MRKGAAEERGGRGRCRLGVPVDNLRPSQSVSEGVAGRKRHLHKRSDQETAGRWEGGDAGPDGLAAPVPVQVDSDFSPLHLQVRPMPFPALCC
eukprot:768074-Hanusia_phi.AAC.3